MLTVDMNGFVISKEEDFEPNPNRVGMVDPVSMWTHLGKNCLIFHTTYNDDYCTHITIADTRTGKRIKVKFEDTGLRKCMNCHKVYDNRDEDWKDAIKNEICPQADALGMESLTETEQTLLLGGLHVCSEECYYAL